MLAQTGDSIRESKCHKKTHAQEQVSQPQDDGGDGS